MDDRARIIAAEREFNQERQAKWDFDEFNEWLYDRYGVVYRPHLYSFCEIVNPDRYVFFLLKWP